MSTSQLVIRIYLSKDFMATLEKGWTLPEAGYRKFISSLLTYALSRKLDRKKFEVVHEGNLDLHNPDSDTPDVIVHDIEDSYNPVLMVVICFDANEKDTLRTVEIIREIYAVKEAFVYNIESDHWISCTSSMFAFTSYSALFKVELNQLLERYLHRYI